MKIKQIANKTEYETNFKKKLNINKIAKKN